MAFFQAVSDFRAEITKAGNEGALAVVNEAFGINFAQQLTPAVIEALGGPNGILYKADGTQRNAAETVAFFQAVAELRQGILDSPERDGLFRLFREAYGIDLSNGISASELTTLASEQLGILYGENAALRDIGQAVRFYEAAVHFNTAYESLSASDRAKVDEILSILGIDTASGLYTPANLKALGEEGVLFAAITDTAQGEIQVERNHAVTLKFYVFAIDLRNDLMALEKTDPELARAIDDLFSELFGFRLLDGIQKPEIPKIANALFKEDGTLRDPKEVLEFFKRLVRERAGAGLFLGGAPSFPGFGGGSGVGGGGVGTGGPGGGVGGPGASLPRTEPGRIRFEHILIDYEWQVPEAQYQQPSPAEAAQSAAERQARQDAQVREEEQAADQAIETARQFLAVYNQFRDYLLSLEFTLGQTPPAAPGAEQAADPGPAAPAEGYVMSDRTRAVLMALAATGILLTAAYYLRRRREAGRQLTQEEQRLLQDAERILNELRRPTTRPVAEPVTETAPEPTTPITAGEERTAPAIEGPNPLQVIQAARERLRQLQVDLVRVAATVTAPNAAQGLAQQIGDEVAEIHRQLIERYGYGFERIDQTVSQDAVRDLRMQRIEIAERLAELRAQDEPDADAISALERRRDALTELIEGNADDLIRQVETDIDYFAVNLSKYGAAYAAPAPVTDEIREIFDRIKDQAVFRAAFREATGQELPADLGDTVAARRVVQFIEAIRRTQPRPLTVSAAETPAEEAAVESTQPTAEELARPAIQQLRTQHARRWVRNTLLALGVIIVLPVVLLVGVPLVLAWIAQSTAPQVPARVEQPAAIVAPAEPGPKRTMNLGFLLPDLGPAFEAKVPELRIRIMLATPTAEGEAVLQDAKRAQDIQNELKALNNERTLLNAQLAKSPSGPAAAADKKRVAEINERIFELVGNPFSYDLSDNTLQRPIDYYQRKTVLLEQLAAEIRKQPAGRQDELRDLEENRIPAAKSLVKTLEQRAKIVRDYREKARLSLERAMAALMTSPSEIGALRHRDQWDLPIPGLQGETYGMFRVTPPGAPRAFAGQVKIFWNTAKGEFDFDFVGQYAEGQLPKGLRDRFDVQSSRYYFYDAATGTFFFRYTQGREILFEDGKGIHSMLPLVDEISKFGGRAQPGLGRVLYPKVRPPFATVEPVTKERFDAVNRDQRRWKDMGVIGTVDLDANGNVRSVIFRGGLDATDIRTGSLYVLTPGGGYQMKWVDRRTGQIRQSGFSVSNLEIVSFTSIEDARIQELGFTVPWLSEMKLRFDVVGGVIGDGAKGPVERGSWLFAEAPYFFLGDRAYTNFAENELPGIVLGLYAQLQKEPNEVNLRLLDRASDKGVTVDRNRGLRAAHPSTGYAQTKAVEALLGYGDQTLWVSQQFDALLRPWGAAGPELEPLVDVPPLAPQTALGGRAKDTARTVEVVPGVPLTALPAELSIDNKIRVPMLAADRAGKHREPAGATKGQPGRAWNVVIGTDGRFESVEVLDARGKVDFILTGNVRINGKAVESIDFAATPLKVTDQISADFITVNYRTAQGHVTGGMTSTLTGPFTYPAMNPHDPATTLIGVARRQTISLGTTADGLYDGFEVRTYLLDGKGEHVLRDGAALYVSQVEYRRKADNSRAFAIYGDARLVIVAGQQPRIEKGPTGDSAGEVEIVDAAHPGRALIYRYDTARSGDLTGPIAVLQRQPLKATFKGATYDVFVRTGVGGLVEKVFAVDPDLGERLLFQANAAGKMEVLDVPTGDIYSLKGASGYTVGDLIATTERKGDVTVDGTDYPLLVRHPVADPAKVEQVIAVDVRGTTVVRYYQKSAGVWEAEIVATGAVRQADATTYALGEAAGSIRPTGRTVTLAGTTYTLKERLDAGGKVVGVFGFDRLGRLGLNYFRSPEGTWLEAEAGGAVYAVTDQATYALDARSSGTIERGPDITVGGQTYSLRTRKDDQGKVLRIFAIDGFGNEGVRYALDGTGKATELEHVPTGDIYAVGRFLAPQDKLATTRTIAGGLTVAGQPQDVKVQTNLDGSFRRAFAIDAQGKEVATFYRRPDTVGGQAVAGLWVIDNGRTAAQDLPAGAAAKMGYTGREPLRTIHFADSDYKLLEGLGVKGYTVKTDRTVSFNGQTWQLTDEIDAKGRFLIGRGVDVNGKERATVTLMPEGIYQVEIVEKTVEEIEPGAARQLIRTAYTAGLDGATYKTDQKIVQTAYVTAYTVELDPAKIPAQLTRLVLDATDIPDSSKPMARAKLEQSIRAIATSVGAERTVTLVKTEVEMSNGSKSYFYRIKEDPLARVVIFRSSDVQANAVVNVEWDQSSGRKGYEFSPMGLVYLQEAGTPTVTSEDLLRDHQLTAVLGQLKQRGVVLPTEPFSKVTRSLLVDGDETRKVPMDIRYLLPNDPSARDFARVSRGSVRFIKWSQDPRVPYGVAAGEVVAVGGAHQEILRETTFVTWDKDRNEYIYRMVSELRNGQEMSDPHVLVGYNVTTGLLWEHYVDEEWKLYSKDGFPLYIHRIGKTSDPVAGPYASRTYESPFDGRTYGVQGQEYRHSYFVTRAWVHPTTGEVFVLTSEKFDTTTPFYGPSNFLVRNGELVAIIEGDDANRLVHVDPYRNPITEKVYNSLPGVIARGVGGWAGVETHEVIADRVEREGRAVDLQQPDESGRAELAVYYDPLRDLMAHWYVLALLGGAALLSVPVAMRYLGRRDRGHHSGNPSAADLSALDQVFIEGLGETTDAAPPSADTDTDGARLAIQERSASYDNILGITQTYFDGLSARLTTEFGLASDAAAVPDATVDLANTYSDITSVRRSEPVDLNAFLASSEGEQARTEAKEAVARGEFVKLSLWGGQATRAASILGGGAKSLYRLSNFATLDLRSIPLADFGGKNDAENEAIRGRLEAFQDQVQQEASRAQDNAFQQYLLSLSLGAHEVIQYRAELEKLSRELRSELSPEEFVRQNGKLIVSINSLTGAEIVQEWVDNGFFGFDPRNILFVQANTFPVYLRRSDGSFSPMTDTDAQTYGLEEPVRHVFGHGLISHDLKAAGTGFTVTVNGKPQYVTDRSPYEYFLERGGKIVSNANIDDNPQLTSEALPIDRLALLLHLNKSQNGAYETIFEGLLNLTGQKGGSAATVTGDTDFTIEGHALKSPATKTFTDSSPFLNRMLTFSFIASQVRDKRETDFALTKKVQKTAKGDLVYYIPENFYTDSVTRLTRSRAIQQPGLAINAFKSPVNVVVGVPAKDQRPEVPGTGPLLLEQHRNPDFLAVAESVYSASAGARLAQTALLRHARRQFKEQLLDAIEGDRREADIRRVFEAILSDGALHPDMGTNAQQFDAWLDGLLDLNPTQILDRLRELTPYELAGLTLTRILEYEVGWSTDRFRYTYQTGLGRRYPAGDHRLDNLKFAIGEVIGTRSIILHRAGTTSRSRSSTAPSAGPSTSA
ncbi:MAG: hypothetical protein MOGMAGMI_01693 [Candidatus Omnitrophica bacterium]|nr:hypothetical protein [Candidatus Omnitrophota bacterium]